MAGKSAVHSNEAGWGVFSNKNEGIDATPPGKASKENFERPY